MKTGQVTTNTPTSIQIRLSKFDNQAQQYKLFRTIVVTEDVMAKFVIEKLLHSKEVMEFYLYEWNQKDLPVQYYSINPDVFESIEVSQIHMT